jgi:hypothetical protein
MPKGASTSSGDWRPLSAAQKAQLLEVAGSTPVTSVLAAGITIQSAVID